MGSAASLVCGNPASGDLASILANISWSIDKYYQKCVSFIQEDPSDDLTLMGSFCARTLLENGCVALVGRFDPFRLLTVKKFQDNPAFELHRRMKAGIQWSGDVVAEKSAGAQMWGHEVPLEKVSRALLSDYMDEAVWRSAFSSFLDKIDEFPDCDRKRDLIRLPPEGFVSDVRQRASRVYSALSKGVHMEFVLPIATKLDAMTVKDNIKDAVLILLDLALISHFAHCAHFKLEPLVAFELVRDVEEAINA